MKLMAISSQGKGEIEDFEDCWRRSLLEFLEFSNDAAARKVDLRLSNDKMEDGYQRRRYL